MATDAKVTTIIRSYNRRDGTLAAIESVLAQSLPGQPIVVVDDGSTDGVAEAVKQRFQDRVEVLQHPTNRGVGAAANTGMAAVRTPFVAFLDSDDLWEADFLERMLRAIMEAPGATLAYCDIRLEFPEHALDYGVCLKGPEVIESQLHLPPFTMSSVLCRTRSAKAIGLFSEHKKIGEDSDFYLRLWLRVPDSFVHVDRELVRHRIWSGNITNDVNTLIQEMDALVRKYIKHPYFFEIRDSYSQVVRQKLLSIAARHQVIKWLSQDSSRTISLVVSDAGNPDDLRRSLASAVDQRLPPIDVTILVDKSSEQEKSAKELASENWPFRVNVLPVRGGCPIGEAVQLAINVLMGNVVLFLSAGEEFVDGALDLHRHAFSCSPQSVTMSFGGLDSRIPVAMPHNRHAIAASMIRCGVPFSLSTIAVPRSLLLNSKVIAKHWNKGFCLGLALGLLGNSGPIVRVSKPVVKGAVHEVIEPDTLRAILRDLSEMDNCHDLIGVFDEVLDGCGSG